MDHICRSDFSVSGLRRRSMPFLRSRGPRKLAIIFAALTGSTQLADARGGIGGGGDPAPPPPTVLNFMPNPGPTLPALPLKFGPNGFSIVGFIEKATVTGGCGGAPGSTAGGTVVINGTVITVPSNTIGQFPAQTLKWADPMCLPRAAPPAPGGAETDPLCPQKNRPIASAAAPCRNFLAAGVVLPKIPGGDLPASPKGSFCSAFVMKAIAGMPGTASLAPGNIAGPSDPDPRQQAPLEVGDFITWSGTLVRDALRGRVAPTGPLITRANGAQPRLRKNPA